MLLGFRDSSGRVEQMFRRLVRVTIIIVQVDAETARVIFSELPEILPSFFRIGDNSLRQGFA